MKKYLRIMTITIVVSFQLTYPVFAEFNEPDIMDWKKVNELIPKYTKFTVHDMETGKEFIVQRRAGSNHADVQPLTSKDTAIMKDIYGGKWSWKRRAIIVIHNDFRIAASMHGMPHGGGALQNNFPGHFCIHFHGSTTHRTTTMDLSHQLMMLKAAGKIDEFITKNSPYDNVYAFIASLKQQDPFLIEKLAIQQQIHWKKIIPRIENIAVTHMSVIPEEDTTDQLFLTVPVTVELYVTKMGKVIWEGEFKLSRVSFFEPWRVDPYQFLKEINMVK